MDLNRTILDRSALDNRKQEEKELHDLLYKKLQALTLIHRPTEDFKSIFTKDMFLKSNPRACIYVMHFLITLYMDQDEFKAKFFWPIKDKKSESLFRSSVVTYLTELNEKHHLNWIHLKNYLISVPGGMKFITFLLEYINFIVAELTRRREKELMMQSHHNQNHNQKIIKERFIRNCSINDISKELDNFKKTTKEYEERMDLVTSHIKQHIDFINSELSDFSLRTNISVKQLIDKNFLMKFAADNQKKLQNLITNYTNPLKNMEKPLQDLKKHMESCQEHLKHSFDKDELMKAFNDIQKLYPEQLKESKIFQGNDINTETLISSLNLIAPIIYESFRNIELNTNVEHLKFEETELNSIMKDLTDLECKINDYKQLMNDEHIDDGGEGKRDGAAGIGGGAMSLNLMKTPSTYLSHKFKFISTPPILTLNPNNPNSGRLLTTKQRLPFLLNDMPLPGDKTLLPSTIRKYNERKHLYTTAHSAKKNQNTTILSKSSYRCGKQNKIYDPKHMLKAIMKRNSTKHLRKISSSSSPPASSLSSTQLQLLSRTCKKNTLQAINTIERQKRVLQQQQQYQLQRQRQQHQLQRQQHQHQLQRQQQHQLQQQQKQRQQPHQQIKEKQQFPSTKCFQQQNPLNTTSTIELITKTIHEKFYSPPTKLDRLKSGGNNNNDPTDDGYDIRKITTSPSGRLNSVIQISSTSKLSSPSLQLPSSVASPSPSPSLSLSSSSSSSLTLVDQKYTTKIQIKDKSLISEQSSTLSLSNDNFFNKSILEETEINIKIKNIRETDEKNITDLLLIKDINQNDNNQNNINTNTNKNMNDNDKSNNNDLINETLCSDFIEKLNLNFNDDNSLCNTSDTVLNDLPPI